MLLTMKKFHKYFWVIGFLLVCNPPKSISAQNISFENPEIEIDSSDLNKIKRDPVILINEGDSLSIEDSVFLNEMHTSIGYMIEDYDTLTKIKEIVVMDSLQDSFNPSGHPSNLYYQGYHEGRLFYRKKGTFWSAFAIGFVSPYIAFIPGVVTGGLVAAIPPNERSLRYYDTRMLNARMDGYNKEVNHLFEDINYSRGYRKGAHVRKAGNVAGGFGAGFGTGIALALVIFASILSVY